MKNFIMNLFGFIFKLTAAAVIAIIIILNVGLVKEHFDNKALKENTKSINLFNHSVSWSERVEPTENKIVDLFDEIVEEVEYRIS